MNFTAQNLRLIAPRAKDQIIGAIVGPLNACMEEYEINTPLRAAHFIAQAAHETDCFRTLYEYASGQAYEGRKDLGNVNPGDGKRYKGRGIFQLTGRVNYRAYGRFLGIDLENNPEIAADPEVSVRVACEYWKRKGLNVWADRDDVVEITKKINGGQNGLADRKHYLEVAKKILNTDSEPAPEVLPVPDEEIPDAPIAAEPAEPVSIMQDGKAQTAGGIGIGAILSMIDWRVFLIFAVLVFLSLVFFIGRERVGDWLKENLPPLIERTKKRIMG